MAKRSNKLLLPLDTKIEVVVSKGLDVRKKIMTYQEALELKNMKGWRYQFFQIGFCTIPENRIIK